MIFALHIPGKFGPHLHRSTMRTTNNRARSNSKNPVSTMMGKNKSFNGMRYAFDFVIPSFRVPNTLDYTITTTSNTAFVSIFEGELL